MSILSLGSHQSSIERRSSSSVRFAINRQFNINTHAHQCHLNKRGITTCSAFTASRDRRSACSDLRSRVFDPTRVRPKPSPRPQADCCHHGPHQRTACSLVPRSRTGSAMSRLAIILTELDRRTRARRTCHIAAPSVTRWNVGNRAFIRHAAGTALARVSKRHAPRHGSPGRAAAMRDDRHGRYNSRLPECAS
jgi:hypothetical protein